MKIREFIVHGVRVELWDFGYSQFLYTTYNGAEYPVTKEGFKRLSHYCRFMNHVDLLMAGEISYSDEYCAKLLNV